MSTLNEHLERRLGAHGGETALIWGERDRTFAELDSWAAALATAIGERGVGTGDRVAVGLANGPLLVAAVLAVLRRGAVLVPVNPNATASEAAYVIAHSEAALVISSNEQLDAWDLPDETAVLVPEQDDPESGAAHPWKRVEASDPALHMYTSGTTGRPKGVVLSHGAIAGNLATVADAWRWTAEDRLLLTLPCFHLHGLALGILGSLLVGSSVVMRERFVADEIAALIDRHRCTLFFGVPTMYNRLLQTGATPEGRPAMGTMRLWVSGSAPLTAAAFAEFRDLYRHEILERFGMSEGGFMIATPYDGPRRPGVVGLPLPGIEIRLIDPDAAAAGRVVDVGDGQPGEIAIRGANLFSGYWRDPEATRAAFVGPYFRSGDLAVREPDAMIRIVGRISVDIIKCRGFKISAIEIENRLQTHPDVAEVAVVGVPHADLGEEIVAVVTPRDGIDPASLQTEDLLAYAAGALARHKVPSRIVPMSEIPRTGPGKFKKRELIERLREAGRGGGGSGSV